MRAIAVHSVDMDIRGVRLGTEAIIANVNPGPLHRNILDVKGIEEVGILRQRGRIVRFRRHDHVLEGDTFRRDDEVRPAGGVLFVNALHAEVCGILRIEQDRSEVLVIRVQNLQTGELVPPPLAVPIENSLAVDGNVVTSPLPEHERVLEGMRERIGLPVWRVVGELHFAIPVHVDVVEEGQVKRLAEYEDLVLGKVQSAAVVRLMQALEKVVSDIVGVIG